VAAVPLFSSCLLRRHFSKPAKFLAVVRSPAVRTDCRLRRIVADGLRRRCDDSNDRDGHSETSTSRLNMGQHRTSPKLFQA